MRLARCGEVAPIDIGHTDTLLSPAKKGGSHASVLHEVPRQERDQEPQEHCHEEQATGNSGRLSDLWHEGISNRQVGLLSVSRTEPRRAGYSPSGDVQPFRFASDQHFKFMCDSTVHRVRVLASPRVL